MGYVMNFTQAYLGRLQARAEHCKEKKNKKIFS